MDFEFLKDRYDFELARRESLTSALTLPVGMWTALFLPCLGADVAAFVVALCFLALAYHGQNYGYLPRLGELRADEEEMQRYFEENGGDQELAHEEFMRQLERRIIEAADKSAMSNDRRATYLHRARQSLFTVSMLTFLTGLVFVLAKVE
jgi:hypothetical protein